MGRAGGLTLTFGRRKLSYPSPSIGSKASHMAQSRDFDSAARLPGHFSGDAVIPVADPKSIGEEVRDGIPGRLQSWWIKVYKV